MQTIMILVLKISKSKITESLLNRKAVTVLVTHQSYSDPREKNLCKPRDLQSATRPFLVSSRNVPPHKRLWGGALRDDTKNDCVEDDGICLLLGTPSP